MEDLEAQGVDPFELFPEKIRESVTGLTYLGYIERDVKFCGHTFVVRTLKPSEKMAIAIAVKPWRETVAESEVWANAHVGLSLVSVDGDESFCPSIGPDLNSFARARLNYVTDHEQGWYQATLDYLFNFYLGLEQEALNAMEEFQDLEERSQQPSPPSADSLTTPGTSQNETATETPPSDPSR